MFVITLIILAIAAYFLIQYLRKRAENGAATPDALAHDQQGSTRTLSGQRAATEAEHHDATREHVAAHPEKANGTRDADVAVHAGSANDTMASDVAHLDKGDSRDNVREMMKILNLRDSDASRLDISREDFARLWQADASASDSLVDDVSKRLKSMMH